MRLFKNILQKSMSVFILSALLATTPAVYAQGSFGPFSSAMQIMTGDSNAPEPPGPGGDVDEYIRLHAEMGFKWDRTNIAWGSVEYPKGTYHWEEIDSRLYKMKNAGINSSIIVYGGNNYDGTIYWDNYMPGFDGLAGTQQEYLEFVKKVVERYDGDGYNDANFIDANTNVKFWEGWNEPVQFAGVSVQQATNLHIGYYAAIKEACPDCIVSSPGFAYDSRTEEFMTTAGGINSFDMLSAHSNYHNRSNAEEHMLNKINWQDDAFKSWGLGSRPWWISEFGDNSSGDETHAMRTARMYVVARYSMFHSNLICATEWPNEGPGNHLIDWDNWILKPDGKATKVVISFLQNGSINGSERIVDGDIRVYKFSRSDGLNTYVLWTLEGSSANYNLSTSSTKIRVSDIYGNNEHVLTVPTKTYAISMTEDPIFVEEITDDTVDPNPPKNLISPSQTESAITLQWDPPDPADDADTASSYRITRDGATITTVTETTYTDGLLTESTAYDYAVYSIDDSGNESDQPVTGTFNTLSDHTPPDVIAVSATSANSIQVVFNEKVNQTAAEDVSNYTLNNGATIQNGTLHTDDVTVTLIISQLQENIVYQLTITGVKDRAAAQNQITSPIVRSFQFVSDLEITNISIATGKEYISAHLFVADEFYVDRTTAIAEIPSNYDSLLWIKTANDDKLESSPNNFLTYDVNQNVIVYLGYDIRLNIPDWLIGWTDTGDNIKSDAQEGKNIYRLYSKVFPMGTVVLGPNSAGTNSSNMYIVLNKGNANVSLPDSIPPDPPTGIRIKTVGDDQ